MAQEIERKFLVDGDFRSEAFKAVRITQGYLSSVPERTVRVRVKDDKGYITVKGVGDESGVSRFEWEKEIPVDDARELLRICEPGVIDKTRYLVKVGTHTFSDPNEAFGKPSWLGEEVTGDKRYYNSFLSGHPYRTWRKTE